MLGGNLIELMANRSDGSRQAQKMYQDTHALVRHVCGRLHKSIPQGGAGVQESRLAVLSLRVQAVLSHRIYLIMSRDRERSTAALHEFQSLNLAKLASGYEGSAVSNGATASPAGSHSSASSGVLLTSGSGRDNGVPGSAPNSQGGSGQPVRSYTLPAGLVENVQKAVHRMMYLQRAFDLWNQSGNYMVETHNKEFFDAAASAACSSGYVDLFTPTSEFVKFARETIFRIEELTNVS
ncbi:hypothetical protein BIW11_00147 [Tropilaelaps mercedesae]|uniref:AF4/FMR2 family member lilli n=1 Tax=Tropilaelaps mercedesae TaxID=418985 RepID=A0A1V9Y177_9ACAR|nr:hypothetical protein BIW11_00147 [Tropilaelaps mercedesae]